MTHDFISTSEDLASCLTHLVNAKYIAFDTEFVSEDTYRPELCLIQIATEDYQAVIDPYGISDLNKFWNLLAEGDHITIAHAAREEINFSLTAIDRLPANLFDTQIAAGFCSTEFPSSYSSVVSKFVGNRPAKGEQRTDWRRRPLTDAQINYAMEDVRYLIQLYEIQKEKLLALGRWGWYETEIAQWQIEVTEARGRKRWRKVSGIGNLPIKSLAIVREIWMWRQSQAEKTNKPPRRILRDDLLVEVAKRRSDKVSQIEAIRGMQYSSVKKHLPEIAQCVTRGLAVDPKELMYPSKKSMPSQLNLLGQFLTPALTSICRNATIAASLVGTASDVRELIAYQLEFGDVQNKAIPALASGWRAELIGTLIEDLLLGKKAICIENPKSVHPLGFTKVCSDD